MLDDNAKSSESGSALVGCLFCSQSETTPGTALRKWLGDSVGSIKEVSIATFNPHNSSHDSSHDPSHDSSHGSS